MAQCNGRHAPWWLKQPLPCCSLRLQGLADTFLLLGLPFDSPEASELNKQIFETIYFAALRTSMQLAKTEGGLLGRQPTAHPPRLPWLAALRAAGLHQPLCWEYMVVSGRQCWPPCADPYSTYEGSPVSKGILQPDMWGVKPSDRWDWDSLRRDITQVRDLQRRQGLGVRCSLGWA